MNTSTLGSLRSIAVVISLTLATSAATAATQEQFDRATACCWLGTQGYWGAYCSTKSACADGKTYCKSEYFYPYGEGPGRNELRCGVLGSRGDEPEAIPLFVPPAPIQTDGGETLEVSRAVANSLRASTLVMELQRRGASSEELESTTGDDIDVSVTDAGDGERVVTIRGDGADNIVLRFDADGKVQRAPAFTVGDGIKAAMADAARGGSTMSARGVSAPWCGQARATVGGGCALATSMNVGSIPGATGPAFLRTYPSFPASASLLPAGFPTQSWTIPEAYNALSLVEYFNLGFIRTQSELDQFMAFCWIPNPNVAGSGSCQANYYGVCPYDANAGVICESMAGMQ